MLTIDGSFGAPTCAGVPQEPLITYLEELMALARSGEIQALIGVAEHSDGLIQRITVGRSEETLRVLGALEALKKELLN